jgi:hypothetical protein
MNINLYPYYYIESDGYYKVYFENELDNIYITEITLDTDVNMIISLLNDAYQSGIEDSEAIKEIEYEK